MNIRRNIVRILCMAGMCMLLACSENHKLEELDRIKTVGNENPRQALAMLDSLEIGIREESNYVRNKYDLLRIRLNDKADNIPSSDIVIKNLIDYFEKNGSINDKQEVYYYAGSVYRDLHDTPRALEFFLKSVEYAKQDTDCDLIMLRNAYSNLNVLYYNVQKYTDAVSMAHEEYKLAQQTHTGVVLPYLHIGTSYLAQHNYLEACKAFDAAFDSITTSNEVSKHQDALLYLLCDYSLMKKTSKARKCFQLIEADPLNDFSEFTCMAFAQFYDMCNKTDSAIVYAKLMLDKGQDICNMYDASKLLYKIYNKAGDVNHANHYADIYMQLSDSLDFGTRQELAATVNNEYQYHYDQKKEQTLKDEKIRYRNTLVVVILVAVLLSCVAYIFHVHRRNKHLKQIVSLSDELRRVTDDEQQLRKDIEQKEMELEKSRKSLKKSSDELNSVKSELQRVNAELSDYDDALKEKELQLSEKMDQAKTFIKLLHQSELENKAEDVIYAIRQSSKGKKDMKSSDWKQLYQAVDEMYPLFKDRLVKELGNFTEQQMQVCYLMRVGLSKLQIQNMTNLSRVTIWRWVKKYDWILTPDEETE